MAKRFMQAALVVLLGIMSTACSSLNSSDSLITKQLVSAAVDTVNRFRSHKDYKPFTHELDQAYAAVILPSVVKAGLFLGGEGGNGILLKRDAGGQWSYPAFYTLGGASFGMQAGIQDTAIVLIIRNAGALESILNHQGKLGADAGATIWTEGVGAEASTTTNLGADIVAFASSNIGGFVGLSLEGSVLATRHDLNKAYYGAEVEPETILAGGVNNPQADSLRRLLAKN